MPDFKLDTPFPVAPDHVATLHAKVVKANGSKYFVGTVVNTKNGMLYPALFAENGNLAIPYAEGVNTKWCLSTPPGDYTPTALGEIQQILVSIGDKNLANQIVATRYGSSDAMIKQLREYFKCL